MVHVWLTLGGRLPMHGPRANFPKDVDALGDGVINGRVEYCWCVHMQSTSEIWSQHHVLLQDVEVGVPTGCKLLVQRSNTVATEINAL